MTRIATQSAEVQKAVAQFLDGAERLMGLARDLQESLDTDRPSRFQLEVEQARTRLADEVYSLIRAFENDQTPNALRAAFGDVIERGWRAPWGMSLEKGWVPVSDDEVVGV